MGLAAFDQIRTSLLEKSQWVTGWLSSTETSRRRARLGPADEQDVQAHLAVIDDTLQKVDNDTLGICRVCKYPVEPELLEMDYTACVCLGDMSDEESAQLQFELGLAQHVQRSLLPQQAPDTTALEVAAFSRPAQIIGGDYFDFLNLPDGAHGLAIADVAGHGIAASLHMASIQAALRSLAPLSSSPVEISQRVHRLFIHNSQFTTFVTLFLGAYNPQTHLLTYVNAGHNPPLLLRGAGGFWPSIEWLAPTSPAIGLVEEGQFYQQEISLAPGDALLLYTDGATESENALGEPFGAERLAAAVQPAGASAHEMVHLARQAITAFSGDRPQSDDLTLVAVRFVD